MRCKRLRLACGKRLATTVECDTSIDSQNGEKLAHVRFGRARKIRIRRHSEVCRESLLQLHGAVWAVVRVPGREFRFLAPIARQHLFLNLNQLIFWRRIRICLLSFRQSCECCQTNGFARPVLRDRVSLAKRSRARLPIAKYAVFARTFDCFAQLLSTFRKKVLLTND